MNVPLVVRSSRGIELTRFGEALYRRSHQILEDVRRAKEEVRQLQGGATGKVAIGVSGSIALSVMPRALKVLRQRMPAVDIEVVELPQKYLTASLLDGSLDLFVTHSPQEIHEEFEQHVLRQGRLFVTARRGHPATECGSLRELLEYEWLYPSQTIDKGEFTRLFSELGMEAPQNVVTCQSSLLALGLLAETDTIALYPLPYITHSVARDRLTAIRVQEPLPKVTASVITRRGVTLTPAAVTCYEAIQGVMQNLDWV